MKHEGRFTWNSFNVQNNATFGWTNKKGFTEKIDAAAIPAHRKPELAAC